jgi:hypothetical protein
LFENDFRLNVSNAIPSGGKCNLGKYVRSCDEDSV